MAGRACLGSGAAASSRATVSTIDDDSFVAASELNEEADAAAVAVVAITVLSSCSSTGQMYLCRSSDSRQLPNPLVLS